MTEKSLRHLDWEAFKSETLYCPDEIPVQPESLLILRYDMYSRNINAGTMVETADGQPLHSEPIMECSESLHLTSGNN